MLEVAWVFLKLGLTAFGGPVAHVAMMEEEVVRRRGWLDHATFLDMFGATNLIPGPSSTELAFLLGLHRAGYAGMLVAGVCFIAPPATLTMLLAWSYGRFGALPIAIGIARGLSPIVVAIVAQALLGLAPKAAKTVLLRLVAVAAAAAVVLGVPELAVLAGAGVAVVAARRGGSLPPSSAVVLAPVTATPGKVFLVFAKIGASVFGSGYVLLAFLRADLVTRLGWVDERTLLDAVAAGQVTPGPLFTTATFLGYLVGGVPTALAATAGIFLPGFLVIAVSGALVPRMRRSVVAGAFLDGVNVASLALMTVVTIQLARAALVDVVAGALFLVALAALLRFRVRATWLVALGAVLGAARTLAGV